MPRRRRRLGEESARCFEQGEHVLGAALSCGGAAGLFAAIAKRELRVKRDRVVTRCKHGGRAERGADRVYVALRDGPCETGALKAESRRKAFEKETRQR